MSGGLRIAQNDPGAAYRAYRAEFDEAWRRVMESGRYVLGPEVAEFERGFAAFIGVPHAVGTASGTDAIELALRALDVGPGDVVFTVSLTAVATVAAIVRCGAEPVFVDVDPLSYTMDPNQLEQAIQCCAHAIGPRGAGRLRAIVPVHLYGHPADMPAICQIAQRFELRVVEDCAQSHGAEWAGRRTGTSGDLAAFSFYPTKNLGTFGDGGAIVTADPSLADTCRSLREYGWNPQRVSLRSGCNSRLDELHAAILRVRLRHFSSDQVARANLANIYDQSIVQPDIRKPRVRDGATHAYHQYVVRYARRDALRSFLAQHGVDTAVHYALPAHQHPALSRFHAGDNPLHQSERAAAEVLSLPMYAQLPAESARLVAEVVGQWCDQDPSSNG